MKTRLLHTPEGVRDIYGSEYEQKMAMKQTLHREFHLYGYEDIETPTFEYFDIFSNNIGTVPSAELYKFFDKEGNTLVLRPDFTPSVARCVAKYFMDETLPIRFCYLGNTFMNISDLQGKLKEVTQIGVEMINDDSVYADAEMIALMAHGMRSVSLTEFQITLGNVEFFKGLCEEFGIDNETEMDLREFISNKNYFGAEQILDSMQIDETVKSKLLKVTELFGAAETIRSARSIVTNARSIGALDRLEQIYEILGKQDLAQYLTFDLGMLSKYNYYTGVIFKAYTYGSGDAVMKGGRYDRLLSEFGKDAPAIGFVAMLEDLVFAVRRLGYGQRFAEPALLIVYERESYDAAAKTAEKLRAEDRKVILIRKEDDKTKEDYLTYAKARGYSLIEKYGWETK